ncbi:DNA mismatch repair endonuclease MutL, partial [Clostridium neonatale]
YNNGKKIIHTFGNGDIKDVIRTIYGRNISEDIIYFEDTSDLVTIHGYVGREDIARGSRNNQSTFVNKRYIKNKSLAVAVEQAFKSFSTVNKFPFFILYIEIYPEYVDVNIHPTKAEIKFNDERMIFGKIFNAVHTALKNDVFDDFAIKEEEEIFKETSKIPSFEEIAFKIKEEEEKVKIASNIAKEVMDGGKILNVNLSSEKPKEEINIPVDLKTNSESYASAQFPVETTFHEKYDLKNDIISEEYTTIDLKKEENIYSEEPKNINNVSNSTNNEVKSAKFPPITIIGQYNKTYILGEYDSTLYMIDQHAAHEKILFEKYLKEIENGDIVIQPLMVPTIIDLTIDDYSYYEENIKVFKEAGFVLEEFGGTSLALKEVPYFLGRLNAKKLFLEILDNLKNLGNGKTSEVKHNAIATKACKAAVKGNDKLEFNEMIKLVEELRYIDDPFHCPHGRPVIVKFTSTDIDKKFRRIV